MREKNLRPRPHAGDRVLWIRFSAFGDVLQAAASAHRFKMKYPDVSLTFLTKQGYASILEVQPYIDGLLFWDIKKKPLDFFRLVREIRGMGFKWLFSMHRGTAAALVSLSSGIPLRYGYNSGMQFCYRTTHLEYLDSLGVDFKNRGVPSIFTSREDRDEARSMLARLPDKRLFAVIGASKPQKFWPVRHWIEFLSRLVPEGWGVILNGHGDEEAATAREIEDALQSEAVLNLVGRMSFSLNAAVAQAATVAVGNDTGPLHLAALAGTPTLGFFGVTDAYGMNFRMPWFRDVKVTCPDAGCRNYDCPKDCLADISPDRALSAFREFVSTI
ncbi:MAG: glycosyltransferase family 9 protein [Synergistaceae bacterium]|jgi:ADP-heptose:LPS heptosyltransferase|nr:glycosyltransferase family 9 protein [Synergistaceae bacterium]